MNTQLNSLATCVQVALDAGLRARGRAVMALSGGSTPAFYMPALAALPLDWPRITLTLADERLVPADHAASNEGLNRRLISNTPMADAPLVSLQAAGAPRLDALDALPWPLDVVLLGLGADGHIASLFPQHASLDAQAERLVTCPAPLPPHPQHGRISLSPGAIAAARLVVLAFTGADKQRIWQQAQATGPVADLPARLLVGHPGLRVFDLT